MSKPTRDRKAHAVRIKLQWFLVMLLRNLADAARHGVCHMHKETCVVTWVQDNPQPIYRNTDILRTASIKFIDVQVQGPRSFLTPTQAEQVQKPPISDITIEAWVQLAQRVDRDMETTLVSYGRFAVHLRPPGAPALMLRPNATSYQDKYEIISRRRGYCGNLGLTSNKSSTADDAVTYCSNTPGKMYIRLCSCSTNIEIDAYAIYQKFWPAAGCTAGTMDLNTGDTWVCRAMYSADDPQPDWISFKKQAQHLDYSMTVPLNEWQHIAVTYDVSRQLSSVYVNGLLSHSHSMPLVGTHSSAAAPSVEVGYSIVEGWLPSFPGKIGNVRVWGSVLTITDIQESMMSDQAPASLAQHQVLLMDISKHTATATKQPAPAEWPKGFPLTQTGLRETQDGNPAAQRLSPPSRLSVAIVIGHQHWDPAIVSQVSHMISKTGQCCNITVVHTFQEQTLLDQTQPLRAKLQKDLQLSITFVLPSNNSPQQMDWSQAVGNALLHTDVSNADFVMLMHAKLQPASNWLQQLVSTISSQNDTVAAVQSRLLFPDGTIANMGYEFQMAYIYDMDKQLPTPVALLQGYPMLYKPAMKSRVVQAVGCQAVMVRSSALVYLRESMALPGLGPENTCIDLSLRLRSQQKVLMVEPASMLFVTEPSEKWKEDLLPQRPPAAFYAKWGEALVQQAAANLEVDITVAYNMHCGGSMGIEAFNFLQGLEGYVKVHAQITRGGLYCEHANVLRGTPVSFSDRVRRMRELADYIPGRVFIHHKDYREVAQYVWPLEHPDSYLVGRYMFEVDKIHTQWADHIRTQLNEVWVPSKWHKYQLSAQGVPPSMITVIPESLDSNLFDPALWPKLPLPGRKRYAFVAVFKMEDRKGWKEVVQAFVQEFKTEDEVSLYIHTVTYPGLSYRQDLILTEIQDYLRSVNISNTLQMGDTSLPHIHVMGKHMNQREMLRLYSSMDAFVLASHGEGWGLPYMEAMAMGLPCIATNWSGMTEFMNNDVALLLNYKLGPSNTMNKWFHGTNWAVPDINMLRQHMRLLYTHPDQGKRIGAAARKHIMANYDNMMVGQLILDRLKEIKAVIDTNQPSTLAPLDAHMTGVASDVHLCAEFGQSLAERKSARRQQSTGRQQLQVAMLTTWPPTACGLATFARASVKSLKKTLPQGSKITVFPLVPDAGIVEQHDDQYVHSTIRRSNIRDYITVAEHLNKHRYDVVILQHEFGIWGGTEGAYVVCLARMLKIPTVAVIHTLSDNLRDNNRYVLFHLANSVDRVVVMSTASRNALGSYHAVAKSKVSVIPHGVPRLPMVNIQRLKADLGFSNRVVILSNGLLHPGKGIDLVLRALPAVVKKYPDVLYLVLGKPHPRCGNTCIDHHKWLKEFVASNMLEQHVIFMEVFASEQQLRRILQACDIYVAAYRDRITTNSGALSMAMAAGKLVIATPFEHAMHVLGGRGLLTPFEDPKGIRDALLHALSNPHEMQKLAASAHQYTKNMEWEAVAGMYYSLFKELASTSSSL